MLGSEFPVRRAVNAEHPVVFLHLSAVLQPVMKEGEELDEQLERDRLRKVLKQMGKLKCTREVSCTVQIVN